MKTAVECLKSLPREIQVKWMRNVIKQHDTNHARFILWQSGKNDLYSFISSSFTWAYSKEGHNYWQRIACGKFPQSQNKIVNLFNKLKNQSWQK